VAVILVAGLLRQLAVPATFGRFGHYRGAAVLDARARATRHVGQAKCASCHANEAKLHDKDAHAAVKCEVCHGPGLGHVASHAAKARPATSMRIPRGNAPCLTCHQRLAARPGAFPQITWREHFRSVGVKNEQLLCKTCHNPHEPLFMDRDLRTARLHPLIHRCRDCHTEATRRDTSTPRPPGHPPIFECRTCHGGIVADFSKRAHRTVECTTCHLFFKQSEFAGRIIRDADPRFCLLCHGKGDYRSASGPPSIEWPQHREDMGQGPADATKRCIDCHREKIHRLLQEKGHESASAL
jgi:hypothetical protein